MTECVHVDCDQDAKMVIEFGDGTRRAYCSGHVADLGQLDYIEFDVLRNL